MTRYDDDGVGYSKLQRLLQERNWVEADRQSQQVFYRLAGREKEGYIRDQDILQIPLADLKKLDQIWRKHTQNRFGISVQQKIFLNLEQPKEMKESQFQFWSPLATPFMGARHGSRWKELDKNHWRRFLSCVGWLSDGHFLTERERIQKLCTERSLEQLPVGFLPYEIYRNTLDPLICANPFDFVYVGLVGAAAVLTGDASVSTIGRAFFLFTHRDLNPGNDFDYTPSPEPEPTPDPTPTSPQRSSNGNTYHIQQTIHQYGQNNTAMGYGEANQIGTGVSPEDNKTQK